MGNFITLSMNKMFNIDSNGLLPPPGGTSPKLNLFYFFANLVANISGIITLIMFLIGVVEYFIYRKKAKNQNESIEKKYKKRFLISIITLSIYLVLKILIWTNIIPRFIY